MILNNNSTLPKLKNRNPWAWIPTLYFAEGLPYVIVITVSVIMYKRLGISNADIALYTSWLILPWVIKPLWSPIVDLFKTKRVWIYTMQFFIGVGMAGVAFTIPLPNFFQFTFAFLWLIAFSSATHDISADGFYMLSLTESQQSFFVGIRSTFYRVAMITGQGLFVILAGYLESTSGLPPVDVKVNSVTGPGDRTEILFPKDITGIKDMYIMSEPKIVHISITNCPKSEVDSIIKFVKKSNKRNGFDKTLDEDNIKKEEESWFHKNVVSNIEHFIRKNFGPEIQKVEKTELAGSVGIVYFRLSKKPAEKDEIIFNFGRESGDNSISLVGGERIVFDSENWNKTAMAVIQLDPNLDEMTTATFVGRAGNIPFAWIITFIVIAGLFILFFIYHKFILPYSPADVPAVREKSRGLLNEFFRIFTLFFKKEKIGVILGFILLYRFGEAQLIKLAAPFLLDSQEFGGLALTTGQLGLVYGTVGIIFLTLGGILGGFLVARNGLKYWIWWMILAINLPDIVYVYLAYTQTSNLLLVNVLVAIEQFGYGFGFTAYMLYLIYISEGDHKTSHYAIATGFMALGMMIPGMFSGWLQELIGYKHFFLWVMIATVPSFIIAKFIPIDSSFGKRKTIRS